jgi:hypothetical protein
MSRRIRGVYIWLVLTGKLCGVSTLNILSWHASIVLCCMVYSEDDV